MNNRRLFIKTSLAASPALIFPKLIRFQKHNLKQVLIIGDSISIGYTNYAQNFLLDIAKVSRPMLENAFEQMEMSSDEMNKQLDRSLEMLKKLRVDEKIDDVEDALKNLAKDQEE